MNQKIYGALWEFADQIRSGEKTLAEADRECKALQAAHYKGLKQEGRNPHRFTIQAQLRQYWSFGDPCGLICKGYGINFD